MTPKRDVAAEITALMIEKIESGTMPWERPWHSRSLVPLRHNGERYSAIGRRGTRLEAPDVRAPRPLACRSCGYRKA